MYPTGAEREQGGRSKQGRATYVQGGSGVVETRREGSRQWRITIVQDGVEYLPTVG